ncbi:HEAT repeat-containing protein 2 [Nowakowskiella sp. JEL0078]|nr:HEAT repeat-containing protein 2 [Nowakowskiella sp. JEL0078]
MQALSTTIFGNISTLDDVLETLHLLSTDKSAVVRETLFAIVGAWMRNIPDRHSIAYKLLPLLYAGMVDELAKLRDFAKNEIERAGAVYEEEWEDRVKDEMDYVGNDEYRVGSRHLARDNTMKIVEKCIAGISSWTSELRDHWAKILYIFITFTRGNITGYVGQIFPVLFKVCSGDEIYVMNSATKVAELIGSYVSSQIYLNVCLGHILSGGGSSTQFRVACLRIATALVRGSPDIKHSISYGLDGDKYLDDARLQTVVDIISDKELAGNENLTVLIELASLVHELLERLNPKCNHDQIAENEKCKTLRFEFSDFDENLIGFLEMKRKCEKSLEYMLQVNSDQQSWTNHSTAETRVLSCILTRSESHNITSTRDLISSFSKPLLTEIIIPNLIWHAGKKATVIRAITIRVLILLLQPGSKVAKTNFGPVEALELISLTPVNSDKCVECIQQAGNFSPNSNSKATFFGVLSTCVEDDEAEIRRISICILNNIFSVNFNDGVVDGSQYRLIYPDLLKRLDDAQDDIRILVAKYCLVSMFSSIRRWEAFRSSMASNNNLSSIVIDGNVVEIRLDDIHWVGMVKTLTIHMDDGNYEVQDSSKDALCEMCHVHKRVAAIVNEHILSVRQRHRSRVFVDKVLESVEVTLNI